MSPLTVTPSVAWAAAAAIGIGRALVADERGLDAFARYGASPTPVTRPSAFVMALPPSLMTTAATPTIE